MTEEQWRVYPVKLAEDLEKYQTAIEADYFCARKRVVAESN